MKICQYYFRIIVKFALLLIMYESDHFIIPSSIKVGVLPLKFCKSDKGEMIS